MAIDNRYEFMFYIQCINGNPNGDPDMGNSPRIDPQDMHGYITDVAIKRRIRNYVQIAYGDEDGMDIIMQNATNINRTIAQVKKDAGVKHNDVDNNSIHKSRQKACELFYDVRTFGGVLSTGPNAGQVRGPVQIAFAKSVDKILPLDISITRMCSADGEKGKDLAYYTKIEETTAEEKKRTMGRKQFISYGLYEARGFISANLAAETGFDDSDLKVLFESILNMYEHDRSASKGEMSVISPLIIFKHVGTDTDEKQRSRQCKLGCAAAHKLFGAVKVSKNDEEKLPRNYTDYSCTVNASAIPKGVDVGFMCNPYDEIIWNKQPEGENWISYKK
jgi:CRISPR-associated protein Csd2